MIKDEENLHYEVLGLSQKCSRVDMIWALIVLARQDCSEEIPKRTQDNFGETRRRVEAYNCLRDEWLREAHDQTLPAPNHAGPHTSQSDIKDFAVESEPVESCSKAHLHPDGPARPQSSLGELLSNAHQTKLEDSREATLTDIENLEKAIEEIKGLLAALKEAESSQAPRHTWVSGWTEKRLCRMVALHVLKGRCRAELRARDRFALKGQRLLFYLRTLQHDLERCKGVISEGPVASPEKDLLGDAGSLRRKRTLWKRLTGVRSY